MKFQNILVSAFLIADVTGMTTFETQPVQVDAATASQTASKMTIENTSLTKQGYILRVDSNAFRKINVGKTYYQKALKTTDLFKAKTVSPKKIKNVKFRIEKVAYAPKNASGAPLYLVASKDKKYSCWTTQEGLEYYYLNTKSMSGVTKTLKRIANRENRNLKKINNKRDFNQAMKAAKKLTGKQAVIFYYGSSGIG